MESEWTFATLKEYVERVMEEHYKRHERGERHADQLHEAQRDAVNIAILGIERLLQAAIDASKETLEKMETATDKRFDGLNEKIQSLTDQVNMTTGKGAGLNQGWVYMIAAIGALSALLSIFFGLRGH